MALALDTDFRTAFSAAGPENAVRRAPEGGAGGEAFTKNLERVREAERASAEPASAEASLVQAPPALPPVIPAAAAEAAAITQSAHGSTPLQAIEASAEAEFDTTVATSDAAPATATSAVPAAIQVAPPVDPAAPAPETAISSTPIAATLPAPVAAAPVAEAPAPSTDKSSDIVSPTQPSAAEQPVLVTAAAMTATPVATKAADQSSRVPSIAQTGAAQARPLAKPVAEGTAPLSADAQAAIDAASPDLINAATTEPADPALVTALTSDTGSSSSSAGNSLGLAAAPSAAAPAITASPAPVPMAPAQAMVIASPAAVVDIVSQAAEDGQSDRIVVQLDPPELGRVSIDFKFDAHGLQHVTITSETPEAMRQLRMMHADLVQALERQGIAGQNMSFEHQQQSAQQAPLPNPFARSAAFANASDDEATAAIAAADLRQTARTLPGGRLDIRL